MNEQEQRAAFEEWAGTYWLSFYYETTREAAWAGYQEGYRRALEETGNMKNKEQQQPCPA